jgi:hypothetical protein
VESTLWGCHLAGVFFFFFFGGGKWIELGHVSESFFLLGFGKDADTGDGSGGVDGGGVDAGG